jgi:hypothetical protein
MWLRESEIIDNAMFVRYEDMRQNPVTELQRIMFFLGIAASTQMIEESVEFCSFENMRQSEASNKKPQAEDKKRVEKQEAADAFKSRRGKVSGYSKYLSPQECTHFEQTIRSHLSSAFGYSELPEIVPAIQFGIAR